ncbi:MAG: AraC family transcriptional regulator [Rariglobus sp.]|jgi:AraC-like DNA-binding protein/quercetin dioxygenase-like cupin family protein|nr:AraC family transcriptional regulator [Rariglobus sp.]
MQRLRVADYFFVPELPVAVLAMADQQAMPLHRHEFAELTIITGGAASHLTPEGRYPITAGDVFFIPPELPHGFAETRRLSLTNVLFLPKRLSAMAAEVLRMPGYQALFELEPKYRDAQGFAGHLRLPPEELERVMTLVREIDDEAKRYRPGGTTLIEALFTQLLVRLARGYGAHASSGGRRLLAVQKTIHHIETNHAGPVELKVLARKAGMSLSTFKRAFKGVTGTSPIDYLLQVRLARACHLLRDADKTVTEAALAAGFNDSNYFARQFRARMGCTPREWRNDVR